MQRILVKPKAGLHIRDPKTTLPLPPEGRVVEKRSFWLRRAREGAVTIEKVEEPKEAPKTKVKKG